MNIALGADHAGFPLKEALKSVLRRLGHQVDDLGTTSSDSVDYPDFAHRVARAVAQGTAERGVLVCGSGVGMCMAANRHAGVRAVVLRSREDATLSREHNDANVACLGARMTSEDDAEALLRTWFETSFAGARHAGRVQKIEQGES